MPQEIEQNAPVANEEPAVEAPEEPKKPEIKMVPRDWVDLSVFTDSKYDISSEIELSFIVAEYYTQINFQIPNALSNDVLIEIVAHRTLMMAMPKILTAVVMLDRCPFESHALIEEVCRTHQNIEKNSIVAQLKLVS